MNRNILRAISVIMVLALSASFLVGCGSKTDSDSIGNNDASSSLTDQQKASIDMLNYLTVAVQQINSSRHSRAELEQVYSFLLNNVEPSKIDDRTLEAFNNVLDTIHKFRMTEKARSRSQFLHDQSSALSIFTAVQNPLEVLDDLADKGTLRTLASLAYTTIGAYSESTVTTLEELEFLKLQWDLDDAEDDALHESRKGLFNYMVQVSRDLPEGITLSENDTQEFVTQINTKGVDARLDWLKTNEGRYQYFRDYWLELADCYFEKEDYNSCLAALTKFDSVDTHIFSHDKRLAKSLPFAVVSAQKTMSGKSCEKAVADYTNRIITNTENSDWSLRYFAAESYLALYGDTKNKDYLQLAYDTAKANVRYLVAEQISQNSAYCADLQEVKASAEADDSEVSVVKAYNKYLKKQRETELPPVYEPLLLNCDLLFSVAEELNISQDEKNVIDSILHTEPVFLSEELNQRFSYTESGNVSPSGVDVSYTGLKNYDLKVSLPATFAPAGTKIEADVYSNGEHYYMSDWTVDEVDRHKSNDVVDFVAKFSCDSEKIKFKEGDTITFTITPPGFTTEEDVVCVKIVVDKVSVMGVKFEQVST